MNDTLAIYELWEDGQSLVFFPQIDESMRTTLSPDARMVWSCLAGSWTQAQSMKHEHLGWGPYTPFTSPEPS
jgi:hypothetical protein